MHLRAWRPAASGGVAGADDEASGMGHHEADEADAARHRDRGGGGATTTTSNSMRKRLTATPALAASSPALITSRVHDRPSGARTIATSITAVGMPRSSHRAFASDPSIQNMIPRSSSGFVYAQEAGAGGRGMAWIATPASTSRVGPTCPRRWASTNTSGEVEQRAQEGGAADPEPGDRGPSRDRGERRAKRSARRHTEHIGRRADSCEHLQAGTGEAGARRRPPRRAAHEVCGTPR